MYKKCINICINNNTIGSHLKNQKVYSLNIQKPVADMAINPNTNVLSPLRLHFGCQKMNT